MFYINVYIVYVDKAINVKKDAFSIPKLRRVLRTAQWEDSNHVLVYDNILRSALATLLNIDMIIAAWINEYSAEASPQPSNDLD